MFITIAIILLLISAVLTFMSQPQFGKLPGGKALKKLKGSPNFREGKFQNIHYTPDLKEGASYFTVMKKFFLKKVKEAGLLLHCLP